MPNAETAPGPTACSLLALAPVHDEHYKRLFAFPRMVEDLLRGFVADDWIDELDFSTLQKLSAEYVSDERRTRHGDTVWRVRQRDTWVHVLVLLEFQSTDDPDMALRILEYTALLYRELARNDAMGPDQRHPPVLPVVLYNGDRPWRAARDVSELIAPVGPSLAPYQPSQTYLVLDERHVRDHDVPGWNLMAAVVALEQSRSPDDLRRVVETLQRRPWAPAERELQRVFTEWVRRLALRLMPDAATLPPAVTLEDLKMTLEERVSEWPRQWLQQGIERGREQGIEQGREQGLRQGIEQQRALLRRLAATRFDDHAAERLAPVLARITDPNAIAEIGDRLVRCDTATEFLTDAAALAADSGRRET